MAARWAGNIIILLCLLSVMMLIFGIPVRYNVVMQICDALDCSRRTLNSADLAVLHTNGWTQQGYAIFQIGAELVYILFMGPLAVFLLSQHKHARRRMLYLTAYTFLSLATVLMPEITLNLAQSHPAWYLLYQILKGLSWIGFFYFLFSFPNGHFVPDWLRWFLTIPCLVTVLWLLTGMPEFDSAEEYGIIASVGLLWIGVIAQIYRYRNVASVEERQQTKWLLFGFMLVVIANFVWVVVFQVSQVQSAEARVWVNTFGFLFLTTGPLSVTLALTMGILRYRLWEIDIIINRTLVYSIMTVIVVLLYILIVTLLSTIVSSDNFISSLMATGVVAVSFQSIRERIQQSINRFMFGQRDEPQAVLMQLADRLHEAVQAQDLLRSTLEIVAKTLKLPYTAIHGNDDRLFVDYGISNTPSESLVLVYNGIQVGKLVVGQRSPNELLSPADKRVLQSVAQQLGAVVYAVRLQTDLQAARERLVITREEERLRIRRDLHDGLGPALASLPLKLDAAIDLIAQDQQTSIRLLSDVKRQTQQLVSDVRRVVYDLRPPALDELGLVEALHGSISQLKNRPDGVQIKLHAGDLSDPLPAAVEVAIYRITMEAVTNVLKHAQAQHCWIYLHTLEQPACLQLIIEDDGIGLSQAVVPNVGLQSMRERAEELGGTFLVQVRPAGGTVISVSLPLSEMSSIV